MKLNVGCGGRPARGWVNLDSRHPAADIRWDAMYGLPPTIEEPIQRIYAGHVFQTIEYSDVQVVLELWLGHPMVSSRTLLAITGPDSNKARRMAKEGKLTDEELHLILYGTTSNSRGPHLWECSGGEMYHLARDAGWGVSQPYNLGLLMMDGWPVENLAPWQFGALCRAIK